MSLISIKREYWRESDGTVEKAVLGCAGFDADVEYEKKAVDGLKELKKQCGHIPEINALTPTGLKEGDTPGVDFAHIYNRLYEMTAESHGDIAVDKYGAWGHVDRQGKEHFGDSSGFFPFYTDEETLKKDLKEWDEDVD